MAIRNRKTGEVRFEGFVLQKGLTGPTWNDGYDWTYEAEVWNPISGRPERASYGSTMDTEAHSEVEVDATPDVRALHQEYMARQERKRRIGAELRYLDHAHKGARIEVVRGRKIPRGTAGIVFWTGPDRFSRYGTRVGFKSDAGETLWTAGSNVEVIPTTEHLKMREEWLALDAQDYRDPRVAHPELYPELRPAAA